MYPGSFFRRSLSAFCLAASSAFFISASRSALSCAFACSSAFCRIAFNFSCFQPAAFPMLRRVSPLPLLLSCAVPLMPALNGCILCLKSKYRCILSPPFQACFISSNALSIATRSNRTTLSLKRRVHPILSAHTRKSVFPIPVYAAACSHVNILAVLSLSAILIFNPFLTLRASVCSYCYHK